MAVKNQELIISKLSKEIYISLHDLMIELNQIYPERTVRRWLKEMIDNGIVEKEGQKKSTKYRLIDQSQSKKIDLQNCFSADSNLILKEIRRPLYERLPTPYSQEWFESYEPNRSFYIPEHLRIEMAKAGVRLRKDDPAGTYAHQIFNRLLIDLSYNSSRLEGNTYSLIDTQKLLLEGSSAEGKLDEEKIMILNHKEAIRYLVDSATRLNVNKETLCTLHYLLADGLVEAQYAGKIRDHSVRIGGSTYIPYQTHKKLEDQFENVVKKASKIKDPYEQSLFLLIHISYLQAFTDVNKRTARLSANIPLIKQNLVPLSFNDVDKEDYISAMIAIYELQKCQPIVDLYVYSYLRTCAMYDATIKTIEYDEIRVRYRKERRSIIREIILQKLSGKLIEKYAASESSKLIEKESQQAFLEDLEEDLKALDNSRLAGLGVTPSQLKIWKNLQ